MVSFNTFQKVAELDSNQQISRLDDVIRAFGDMGFPVLYF